MKNDRLEYSARASFAWPLWLELLGFFSLVGLTIFFVAISWRKWPDPLIDFGDQLYTAWRISKGAVLYRDVDLLYGPLSQYFNAALFAIFGPGVMVLVTANLAVFAAILGVLYFLFREAWGVTASLVASAIFIVVFGFSQFVHFGNLNYATPYAHETTHGMLVSLVLCLILVRWAEEPTLLRSFFAGGLFGLTLVLKPEFMLAAAVMTAAAGVVRWRCFGFPGPRVFVLWGVGAVLPTVLFALCFAISMPWQTALSCACRGWLTAVASNSFRSDVLQKGFLGLDQPWLHLTEHALATLLACLFIVFLGGSIWLGESARKTHLFVLLCAVVAAVFAGAAVALIDWIEIGRCFLGLMLIYIPLGALAVWRGKDGKEQLHVHVSRFLLAVLATALMGRMLLHGRIYHYGYYQAALSGMILPAVLIGEFPDWLRVGRRGVAVAVIGTVALLLPGTIILAKRSQARLRLKTEIVGAGRDWFYAFPKEISPDGEMVNEISDVLREMGGANLLVLPEGEMINYLARLPNPIPEFFFFSGFTSGNREQQVVAELKERPPYWVVIISRDLGEYGIERYGEKPGSGQLILQWVDENYERVAAIGGDPLDYGQHGALLLRKYHYP